MTDRPEVFACQLSDADLVRACATEQPENVEVGPIPGDGCRRRPVEEVSEPEASDQIAAPARGDRAANDQASGSLTVLERLKQLEHDATPGPWRPLAPEEPWRGIVSDRCNIAGVAWDGGRQDYEREARADFELIVAMRNALPSLLAIAKQAAVIQAAIEGNSHARLEWDIGLLRAQLARLQETQL